MKRTINPTVPANTNEQAFEELYREISRNWEARAQRLQARRWRALKRIV